MHGTLGKIKTLRTKQINSVNEGLKPSNSIKSGQVKKFKHSWQRDDSKRKPG